MRKVLATFTLSFILIIFVNSQENIDTSLTLSGVHISHNKIHSRVNENIKNIRVIKKQEIESIPTSSLAELLQYFSGVDIKRRGINGVQADISIRGGTFNQVLVMINGIKMIDPQTGHHMMNIPLNTADIEQIEIIKGPAARIYGANAFSGVVNIITKLRDTNDNEPDLHLLSIIGSFNTFENNMSLRLPHENLDQLMSFSFQSSDGYRYNTDYKIGNIFYQSSFKLLNQKLQITGGYTNRKFGANGFYASPAATEQYEVIKTGYAAIETKWVKNNFSLRPILSWRNNRDHYVYIRDNPSVYENDHNSNAYNAELQGTLDSKLGTSRLGVDYSYQTLISNNLGNRERSVFGLYAEQLITLVDDKLDITAGFYLNKFSDRDLDIYPGVDISYDLGSKWYFIGSFNQANRIPTYTNLYYSSPTEQGNENLTSESITSYEIGIKKINRRYHMTASVFYNHNNDLIDWAKYSEDQVQWYAVNYNTVNTFGIDIHAKYDFNQILHTSNEIELSLGYSYLTAEVEENETITVSRYSLDQLNHQLLLGAQVEIFDHFFIDGRFRYLDRETLDNYQLVDTKLSYSKPSYEVSFSVNNLFDTLYQETNQVPMPGRWFSVGLKLK